MTAPVTINQIRRWTNFTRATSTTPSFLYWSSDGAAASTIADTELDTIDPRLVRLMDFCDMRTSVYSACELLQMTIALWYDPPVKLPSGHTGALLEIDAFTPDYVHAVVDIWYICDTGVKNVKYVSGGHRNSIKMPHPWLEQHYPGSVQRLTIAAGLGLHGQDLHAYAFTTPALEEVITLPPLLVYTG